MSSHASMRRGLIGLASLGLIASPLALALTTATATATTTATIQATSTGLVISEVYGGGGNASATYDQDYVELHNTGTTSVDVSTLSVQYRSAGSTANPSGVVPLTGSVAAGDYYLVGLSKGTTGAALPVTPNVSGTTVNLSGTDGTVFLANQKTALTTPPTGSVVNDAAILDLVGYGSSNTYEGTAAAKPTNNTVSLGRSGADTDHNSTDFAVGTPSPEAGVSTGGGGGDCPASPQTIAQIQGDTDTSPCAGTAVTTTGVVTASYPTGGLDGFDIQTGGTPDTPTASDGVFVFAGTHLTAAQYPAVGATVTVTGDVSEYFGLTEVNVTAPSAVTTATAQPPVVPLASVPGTDCALPGTTCPTGSALDALREPHESELVQPTASYTVTDDYDGSPAPSTSSSDFGEIGLVANSATPLLSPTEVADAQDATGIADRTSYNTAHEINVDDGSSVSITSSSNTDVAYPWLTPTHDIRVGSAVTFPKPVVLSYGNSEWRLEPQAQITGTGAGVVNFSDTRATYAAGPANVGGDLRFATFNVLNYFPTTGQEYVASGGTCTFYNDRDGNPITDKDCSKAGASGPRGAARAADLKRQQDKIVHAINALGADVVSLEEIENSVQFGKDRDFGVTTLVSALNADAGAGTWAFDPSPAPADLPPTADQDVIRTAFIYKPASVALVGPSKVLTGSTAFANAREPLAQAFKAVGSPDSDAFGIVVNHLKSKGDDGASPATGDNANGLQGAYNGDRVRQADAMMAFAQQFATDRGITKLFLAGDFNAYSDEDPVQEIEGNDYTAVNDSVAPIDQTYNFGGTNGSLDHIFANAAALPDVTDADVWPINAYESVYYEYSRYNYNVTDLYDTSPFRASDHNPEIVGIDVPPVTTPPPPRRVKPTISIIAPTLVMSGARFRVKVTLTGPDGPVAGHVRGRCQGDHQTEQLVDGRVAFTFRNVRSAPKMIVAISYVGNGTYKPVSRTIKIRVK